MSFGGSDGTGIIGGSSRDDQDAGTCAAEIADGERLPMDMFIMFDVSGSMNRDVGDETRWTIVRQALIDFLSDPESTGIGTGIGYFPEVLPGAPSSCSTDAHCDVPGVGNFGRCFCIQIPFVGCFFGACELADNCQVDAYSTPAVPITLPPTTQPVIDNLLSRPRPAGNTPLRPALEGAHNYAATWAAQHPERKTVVVLVGDGEPVGCTANSLQDSENVVRTAVNGPFQIPTYVIGVGPSLENLNRIAAAGGTEQAYLMSDDEAGTKFKEAMDDIRGRAIPCDLILPEDEDIDPTRVNVTFIPSGATAPQVVPQTFDGSAAGCGPEGGWHYDDPSDPKQIVMCPATCQALSSGGGRQLSIEIGCQTQAAPPPR